MKVMELMKVKKVIETDEIEIRMRFGKPTRGTIKEFFESAKRLVFTEGYGGLGTLGEFRVFAPSNVAMTKFKQAMSKHGFSFDYESPFTNVHVYRIKPKPCKKSKEVIDGEFKMYKPFKLQDKEGDADNTITAIFKWKRNGRTSSKQAQISHVLVNRESEKPINSMVLRIRGEKSVELMKNKKKKPDFEKAIELANEYFRNLITNKESKQMKLWQRS